MSEEVIKIRIDLKGETKKMFEELKKKYNIMHNTEVIRTIIKIAYDHEFKKEL